MLAANFGETLNSRSPSNILAGATQGAIYRRVARRRPARCDVQGTLWGGNLAMLISLIGTPRMPTIDKGILVLEDVNDRFPGGAYAFATGYAGILPNRQAPSFSRQL